MKIRNIKLTVLAFIAVGLILIFWWIQPDLSSASFSLYEFSKGMLVGMSSVTAVVWLIFLINNIKKYNKTDRTTSLIHNKQILLSIVMICFLASLIVMINFSENHLLLAFGTIGMCASMFLNIIPLKGKIKQNLLSN